MQRKPKKREIDGTQQDDFKVEGGDGNAPGIETGVPNEMPILDASVTNASSETASVNKVELLENVVNI